jgi:hypothetical protein
MLIKALVEDADQMAVESCTYFDLLFQGDRVEHSERTHYVQKRARIAGYAVILVD